MKKYKKKIILMSLSFVLVFITMIATTFAWIGIFTYANTNKFDINLRVLDYDADYFLTISSTGQEGTFSDSIETIELKKQIISNMGKDLSMLTNDDAVSLAYEKISSNLFPVTTNVGIDNRFSDFKRMSFETRDGIYNNITQKITPGFVDGSNGYLWFDLYLSVDTKEGVSSKSEINSPVFLTNIEETFIGNLAAHTILMFDSNSEYSFSQIDYSQIGTLPYLNYVPILKDIANSRKININSKNAIRLGFELYEPIPLSDSYDNNNIKSNRIYSAGSKYPLYDKNNDCYDLGGILPNEYNTAMFELMNTKSSLEINVPDEMVNRGDLELNYDNNQIWQSATDLSSPNNYLGVHNGVQTKMRLRTYLWFEGWDADCLLGINNTDVQLNLTFAAAIDNKNE